MFISDLFAILWNPLLITFFVNSLSIMIIIKWPGSPQLKVVLIESRKMEFQNYYATLMDVTFSEHQ